MPVAYAWLAALLTARHFSGLTAVGDPMTSLDPAVAGCSGVLPSHASRHRVSSGGDETKGAREEAGTASLEKLPCTTVNVHN